MNSVIGGIAAVINRYNAAKYSAVLWLSAKKPDFWYSVKKFYFKPLLIGKTR